MNGERQMDKKINCISPWSPVSQYLNSMFVFLYSYFEILGSFILGLALNQ